MPRAGWGRGRHWGTGTYCPCGHMSFQPLLPDTISCSVKCCGVIYQWLEPTITVTWQGMSEKRRIYKAVLRQRGWMARDKKEPCSCPSGWRQQCPGCQPQALEWCFILQTLLLGAWLGKPRSHASQGSSQLSLSWLQPQASASGQDHPSSASRCIQIPSQTPNKKSPKPHGPLNPPRKKN